MAFAGEFARGDLVELALKPVVVDVSSLIIAGRGHYLAEEKPVELLAAFQDFFNKNILLRIGSVEYSHITYRD